MIEIIEINIEKCVGCAYCKIVCHIAAFKVEGVSLFLEQCDKCNRCIVNCPVSAIRKLWED